MPISAHAADREEVGQRDDEFDTATLCTAILRTATQGFAAIDRHGICIYSNASWCRQTGYSDDELHGAPLLDLLHLAATAPGANDPAADRPTANQYNGAARGTAVPLPKEEIFYRKDGSTLIVLRTDHPVVRDGEQVATVIEIADTSERKRIERELRDSEQRALAALRQAQSERSRLDALLEAAPVGIIMADLDGKLIEVNPANRRIWGDAPYSENVEEYRDWKGWWADGSERHGQRLQSSDWAMARALRGEEAPHDIVEIEAFGTGVHSIILNSGAPIRDGEHNIIGAVVAQMDITDRIKAEEALRQADRRKDQFIAVLAHELRNPLAPIRTALDIFGLMCPDDTMLQRAREVMERQLSHMTRLIDDLLDVARISRGIVQLKKERCDLVQIVRRAADDFRDDFIANGVQFELDIPMRPAWMNGDRTRLYQVLSNLLHNAAKFTRSGDTVKVSLAIDADEHGRKARIEVRDSGEGIPASLVPQLFAAFSQEQQDLGRSKGGLGLGLALVKGLTEMHGGTARVTSPGLGQGSVFTITLPLLADVNLPVSRRPGAASAGTLAAHGLRVVVIEDNPDVLETLRMVMSVHNHIVTEATDGSDGIRAIRSARPDVVVCDIGLPGDVDGYAVARAVRADPELRHLRLIALSGYGQDSDKQKSAAAGFDLHLVKPVPFRELEAAMLQKNPDPVS